MNDLSYSRKFIKVSQEKLKPADALKHSSYDHK